jgi:hypothetical protein
MSYVGVCRNVNFARAGVSEPWELAPRSNAGQDFLGLTFENYIVHSFERTSSLAEYRFDTDLVNRFQAEFESPSTQDLLQKQTEMAAADIAQALEYVVAGTAEFEPQSLPYRVAYWHP